MAQNYDRRRINGPDDSVPPIFEDGDSTVLWSAGKPRQGRASGDIRPICLISQANGSAYIETERTKIACAVYGPRQSKTTVYNENGRLNVEVKFAPFSCTRRRAPIRDAEDRSIAMQIHQAILPSVRLELLPKSTIDIFITVIENDGIEGCIASGSLSASAALADAGIEMLGLVISCTASVICGEIWLDPTEEEARAAAGSLIMSGIPALGTITHVWQSGHMTPGQALQPNDSWFPLLTWVMISRRPLRPLPQTEALCKTTFLRPPLDGSLTLPEIFDWHAAHNPKHRVFVYLKNGGIESICWLETVKAIKVAARIMRSRFRMEGSEGSPIVGILATSDFIPYFISIMGLIQANYVVFPISPRNSPAAVAHLMHAVGASHILVGHENSMLELSKHALDIFQSQYPNAAIPMTSPMLSFEGLFLPQADAPGDDTTVLEAIFETTTELTDEFKFALHPHFSEQCLVDKVFAVHSIPMYHTIGVLQLLWTASCGLVLSVFKPQTPAPVPSPDLVFTEAMATNSDVIFCVPSFLEAWSHKAEYVGWLATRMGLLSGGGPINKEVGDYLVSQGIALVNQYGLTETGALSLFLPRQVGYDWEYFRIPQQINVYFAPHGENIYELVVVANHFRVPAKLNTKINGIDAYATSDLVIPHPTKPGYWKVFGRSDDQLIHNTGEKTNPGPLENILNQDIHILASVVFGNGRFQAGVLVDPVPEFNFDATDEPKLAAISNRPTVEKVNAYAPQHSRLFKEMILVSKSSKPFTYTAKNTVRRHAVISDYEEEIDILYDKVEESTQANIPIPSRWDARTTADFVRTVVDKILRYPIRDDDDLFYCGCDSLQATWIRNSILRALRDSVQFDTRKFSGNFVYDHPSVSSLVLHVSRLVSGANDDLDSSGEERTSIMRKMVADYSADFPTHRTDNAVPRSNHGNIILVTGTTGGLGCHILVRLASDANVSRVYALNRASKNKTLLERQKGALIERALDTAALVNDRVVLLEGDLSLPNFGLAENVYEEIHQSLTHIIHNAWPVNFNIPLSSFEPSITGLRRLVDFALTSPQRNPPHLTFASSIGIFQNCANIQTEYETRVPAEVAVGTGYSESKWVSEELLCNAAIQTPLKIVVARLGQICGGGNGAWNLVEWFPAMVQTATVLGQFPVCNGAVSWISPGLAAGALVDLRNAPTETRIAHIVHPYPVTWHFIAITVASELGIALVTYPEWLEKLKRVADTLNNDILEGEVIVERETAHKLRALRLLPFFERVALEMPRDEAMGFNSISYAQAVAASPTLQNASSHQLHTDDVKRWIAYWKEAGLFLNP
ncbi:uncharacterized protein FIBRA_04473 [Fibroporia radiculosa]|uniref:Polyketide synthase-like phosphopantetheine-binding domain-containing protein n=1 Tax=Fibroporia radiculosa TaxID=599839 RepID=J4G7G0_9APHY|nr:uncharacterized protein FIBRA_04473 [Fibroporia radiculosa]CCM02378.1 predicted protein [Fibroporia radiculosa]